MNFVKRAMLYTIHNISKAMILIVLTMILSLSVYCCLAILNEVDPKIENVKEKVLTQVTIFKTPSRSEYVKVIGENVPAMSKSLSDKVAQSKYIKNVNYLLINPVRFEKLTPVGIDIAVIRDKQNTNLANATIVGVRSSDTCAEFLAGGYRLVEGRALTGADAGKSVAIIDEQLAVTNNLSIGSSFTLKIADQNHMVQADRKIISLKIVGLYSGPPIFKHFASDLTMNNFVFVPYTVNQAITPNTSDSILQATYQINNTENVAAFIAEAKQDFITSGDTYQFATNDKWYSRMITPLKNVSLVFGVAVIIFAAVTFIILGLTFFLLLKKRRREIGLLLALGEERVKIAAQILVELLVPVLIAVCLDILLAGSFPQTIANAVLNPQVSAAVKTQQGEYNIIYGNAISPNTDAMFVINGYSPYWNLVNHQAELAMPVSDINISQTASDAIAFIGIGFIIVLFSVLPATVTVLRLKPKKLLIS